MIINSKGLLLQKIHRFIDLGDVPIFYDEYYHFFLEEVPQGSLTYTELEFFGQVQELLDWTAENPSQEEIELGWKSYSGYHKWVKQNLELFINDEVEWSKTWKWNL